MSFGANASARGNGRVGQKHTHTYELAADSNIFSTDPAYAGLTSVWPDATITYTRPDGSKDVLNGHSR